MESACAHKTVISKALEAQRPQRAPRLRTLWSLALSDDGMIPPQQGEAYSNRETRVDLYIMARDVGGKP